MSVKELAEYTTYSKYAQRPKNSSRREVWSEQTSRVMGMHRSKLEDVMSPELDKYLQIAESKLLKKVVF